MSDPKQPEDLPRLTDADRDALDAGYVAIEGVPAGEEPALLKFVPGDMDGGIKDTIPNCVYMVIEAHHRGDDPDGFDRFTGYVRPNVAALVKAAPDLLAALRELLAAELSQMPPYEAGREAQDAWADRRAAARNNARMIIALATGAQS